MSIEIYKVAVSIKLAETVTAGLAALRPHIARTDQDFQALNATLAKTGKLAMLGGGLALAGTAGVKVLENTLSEAKKYQIEMMKLQAQGVGDAALQQADKYAKAQKIFGASAIDTIKMVAEANSVLRDMHHAEEVTPMLLRMKFGIESVMNQGGHGAGHGDQFMAALKTAELRGATSDPITGHFDAKRFEETLNFMTRAYTASGGLVKPQEYLAMIKTGGIAAKGLSDQAFYFGLMHMMQEQGGSRTGTGLMSAFQNMYMGRTTQQVAEEMNKMGLLNTDKLHYGKTGHIAKVDAGALESAELFRTDQFRYMNEIMLPMLRSKGIKDGSEMQMEIAKLFSNRVGGSQWTTMYNERGNIQKHIDAAQGALGSLELAKLGEKGLAGQELQLEKRMSDLKLELGQKILPLAIRGLETLNGLLDRVIGFARDNPATVTALVGLFAGLSALALVGGGVMLISAAFSAMSLIGLGAIGAALGPIAVGLGAIAAVVTTLGIVGSGSNWEASKAAFGIKDTVKPRANEWGREARYVMQVDGRTLGEVTAKHQASAMNGPSTAGPRFDNSMAAPYSMGF